MGTFHHHSRCLSIKSFTSLQMPLPKHILFKSLKKLIIAHATKEAQNQSKHSRGAVVEEQPH
jgi:hypothetical protein